MATEKISTGLGFLSPNPALSWAVSRDELSSLAPSTLKRLENVVAAYERRAGRGEYFVLSLSSLGRRQTSDGRTEPNRPTARQRREYVEDVLLGALRGRGFTVHEIHQGSDGSRKGDYSPTFLGIHGPAETALQAWANGHSGGSFRVDVFLRSPSSNDGSGEPADFSSELGRTYVRPPRSSATAAEPFSVDPDAIDRALDAHNEAQHALAQLLHHHGARPLQPADHGPQYDLAWEHGGVIWVVEVKSTTPTNEEKQLRLGLGQVLRYRQQLCALGSPVRAVLLVPRPVSDPSWAELCNDVGVLLAWPEVLEGVLIDAGALPGQHDPGI